MEIKFKSNSSKLIPVRAHPTDAGADLRSANDYEIYPGETVLVDTGVAVSIPEGFAGLVVPRSSMGKVRVVLANTLGVIDSSYRGNILLRLSNDGDAIFVINKEDTRVSQLIICPVVLATFTKVDSLDDTARGSGGFGSTGV